MTTTKMEEIRKEFYRKFTRDIEVTNNLKQLYWKTDVQFANGPDWIWDWIQEQLEAKDTALEKQREITYELLQELLDNYVVENKAGLLLDFAQKLDNPTPQKDG